MRHGGSVLAPDATLAVHYARELYGRRQELVRLWVVRRADILDLEDPDLLQPPLDRSFKKPGGYVMRDKLETARERAGTVKPTGPAARIEPVTTGAPAGARGAPPGPRRRRVRHRFQRLGVDRDRADPRGGRRDQLARPGRARARAGAVRAPGRAHRLRRRPHRLRPSARRLPPRAPARPGRGDWATTMARRYLYDTADAVRLEALAGSSERPLAELVAKIRREETLPPSPRRRLARPPGERGRRAAPAAARRVGAARARRDVGARPAGGRGRAGRRGHPPGDGVGDDRALARPDPARVRPARAPAARPIGAGPGSRATAPRRGVRVAPRRAERRPASRSGGDLVSATSALDAGGLRAALGESARSRAARGLDRRAGDPRPRRDPPGQGRAVVRVELRPTFVACPATELIRSAVETRLTELAPDLAAEVEFVYDPPWTSDRISPTGRRKLAAAGIAPPARSAVGRSCGSTRSFPARCADRAGPGSTTSSGRRSAVRSAGAPIAASRSRR